ncbi:MAG: UDP-N-acetylmuramoyl-tripeptide--D-alanyl-D-alanine ligase, partial [Acidimicrobiia bacterium]|nr:UDP-N-acetylmuramoyl-tripeptide--D-alanyl-D-alanine ligase [Acidimicrobiia bacterium]
MNGVFVVAATVVGAVSSLRWFRVAQREHYLPWSVSVFARRWWLIDAVNVTLIAMAATSAALALIGVVPLVTGSITLVCILVGPIGLSLKGTSSPLAWTDRLRRVALAAGVLWVTMVAIGGLTGSIGLLAYEAVALPLVVDVALAIMWPLEMRSQRTWIDQALTRITAVKPTVIGITGSYGKTTTKEYTRRLLASHGATVATPASFNNKMGLARAINEHLSDGSQYFIGEMGTYGPGEIAEMCQWVPPQVAVITAIGPVHLERFGSLERVVEAKSEIFADAQVVVLNVDDDRLARLADSIKDKRVIRVSAGKAATADIVLAVDGDNVEVRVDGSVVAQVPSVPLLSNLACAIGVLVGLGLPLAHLADALRGADTPDHRQSVFTSEAGVVIIDDTYNSNPVGGQAALDRLARLGTGRRVVVTPGMVELGDQQAIENRHFAEKAGSVADQLLVVARTNRRALL